MFVPAKSTRDDHSILNRPPHRHKVASPKFLLPAVFHFLIHIGILFVLRRNALTDVLQLARQCDVGSSRDSDTTMRGGVTT